MLDDWLLNDWLLDDWLLNDWLLNDWLLNEPYPEAERVVVVLDSVVDWQFRTDDARIKPNRLYPQRSTLTEHQPLGWLHATVAQRRTAAWGTFSNSTRVDGRAADRLRSTHVPELWAIMPR
ncbi:MAG: hypothetical protein U0821_07805 [Chloroflexota bacterium]